MWKVLLVDDDQNYRYAVKEIIEWEEFGFQITDEAINGSQAVRKVRSQNFDLVITDMSMPLMSGVEFIKEVKKAFPDLIIVALSAYDDFHFVKESLKEGAIDYILKYDMTEANVREVILCVKDMLMARRKEQEKQGILQNVSIQNTEIKRALVYLNEQYQSNLTLQTVSDYVGLNKNYFSNLFKEETGETFTKYLNRLRISKAIELLECGKKLRTYEIAEQVGYQNANYLSKIFKDIKGITIEEYKRIKHL